MPSCLLDRLLLLELSFKKRNYHSSYPHSCLLLSITTNRHRGNRLKRHIYLHDVVAVNEIHYNNRVVSGWTGSCSSSVFSFVSEQHHATLRNGLVQKADKMYSAIKKLLLRRKKILFTRPIFICQFLYDKCLGVTNGLILIKSSRNIWPLLAKILRALACSCSQSFGNCFHARILESGSI